MELPYKLPLEAQLVQACQTWSDALRGVGLPTGSPAVMIVCAAAMDVVKRIRELPALNAVGIRWLAFAGSDCSPRPGLAGAWTLHVCTRCRPAESQSCLRSTSRWRSSKDCWRCMFVA